jgi:hypothetical protein
MWVTIDAALCIPVLLMLKNENAILPFLQKCENSCVNAQIFREISSFLQKCSQKSREYF